MELDSILNMELIIGPATELADKMMDSTLILVEKLMSSVLLG